MNYCQMKFNQEALFNVFRDRITEKSSRVLTIGWESVEQ